MRALAAVGPRVRSGGTTSALAVLAFAVTTAFALSVLGAFLGFRDRATDPPAGVSAIDAGGYVMLAAVAVTLLLVPLGALGGAAARLGVARRDARLATLRLLGVTPREVVALTAVETAAQALAGALLGVLGYGALLPVWTRVPFQGAPFRAAELWVGPWPLAAVVAAVPALAAVSALASLRRVVISPLGVARRQSPPPLRAIRAWVAVGAVALFVLAVRQGAGLAAVIGVLVLLVPLAAVTAGLQLAGPWVVGRVGRTMARRARTPQALLAGRRLADDPRATWRVVGGLGLAAFVAAVLSVLPALTEAGDAGQAVLMADLRTGGLLTLAIAFVLAATATGINQAASVLDRRREHALHRLAGVPVEMFDGVRRREVLVPLLAVVGTGALAGLVVLTPLVGVAGATAPRGLAWLGGTLVAGVLLVLAVTETSGPLLRATLRETVVRAD